MHTHIYVICIPGCVVSFFPNPEPAAQESHCQQYNNSIVLSIVPKKEGLGFVHQSYGEITTVAHEANGTLEELDLSSCSLGCAPRWGYTGIPRYRVLEGRI